jgi:hypothetical protein
VDEDEIWIGEVVYYTNLGNEAKDDPSKDF